MVATEHRDCKTVPRNSAAMLPLIAASTETDASRVERGASLATQEIGPAKNANTEAAVNLEFDGDRVRVGVCVTARRDARILLTCDGNSVLDQRESLGPEKPFVTTLETDGAQPEKCILLVSDSNGKDLIRYQPERRVERELPKSGGSLREELRMPGAMKLLLVGVVLAVLQQWCGINVIFNYAQEIFAAAGYQVSDRLHRCWFRRAHDGWW